MVIFVLIWLGRRVVAWAICLTLELALDPVPLLFPPLVALLPAVEFECDYNILKLQIYSASVYV